MISTGAVSRRGAVTPKASDVGKGASTSPAD